MSDWVFKPNPKLESAQLTWFQSWLVTRQCRNVVAVAARRSGKTVGARAKLITTALNTPNGLVGYVGPTLNQAYRLQWKALMRDLRDPRAAPFVASVNKSRGYIEFANGAYLYLYGAERPEQIRGDGFDLLIVDEADDPNYDTVFFDEIAGPALSDQLGQLIQIGSPKGRGRLYGEWLKGQESTPAESRDSTYETIQVTAIEAGIIDPREIERARLTRPKRAFDQEYRARFNAPIGVIYEAWDEEVHVTSQLPRRVSETFACVDWGTAHRGVMLVVQVDTIYLPPTTDYDGCELSRAWVVHEESHSGTGYDDSGWWAIARRIQAQWAPTVWYADPAGGQEGYLRQLRNALEGSSPMPKVLAADNEVAPGISAVGEFLHHDPSLQEGPRLLVHESCKWLRKHFPAYRWQSHSTVEDEFVNKPVKRDDDELDCLRYGLYTHFYEPEGRRRGRRTEHLEDRGR